MNSPRSSDRLDSSNVEIQQAALGDTGAVTQLVRDSYRQYVAAAGREPLPMNADYRTLISRNEVWVARIRDDIGGVLVLRQVDDYLLLENIAVIPKLRGLGLGRRLMHFAEEFAKKSELSEIRLYTNAVMTQNLHYYSNLGYTETHRETIEDRHAVFFLKVL
jgi:ribosomal protein S18 acetylase RimI-like enzyme